MKTQITLHNAKFIENSFDDNSKQLVGLVRGDSFINKNIPNEPNPRQFIAENNKNYVSMVKTLKQEPEYFSRKNSGGITMFVSACDANGDSTYTLTFRNGDGIANGVHTYEALKRFGRSNSFVKVTIEVRMNRDKVVEIAEALNLNRRLPASTLENKKGTYDWYKEALEEDADDLVYFEGDTGLFNAAESLSFLNLAKVDIKKKEVLIARNLRQSHTNNNITSKSMGSESLQYFEDTTKWIAKDIHQATKYVLFNQELVNHILPIQVYSKKRWTKRYGTMEHVGLIKGLALLPIAGLISVGVKVNKLECVLWKEDFNTWEKRREFLRELTMKTFDIVTVEDRLPSEVVRDKVIHERVLKAAELMATRYAVTQ